MECLKESHIAPVVTWRGQLSKLFQ